MVEHQLCTDINLSVLAPNYGGTIQQAVREFLAANNIPYASFRVDNIDLQDGTVNIALFTNGENLHQLQTIEGIGEIVDIDARIEKERQMQPDYFSL